MKKNTSGNAEQKDGHHEPEDKNIPGSEAGQRIPEEGKPTDTQGIKKTIADSPDCSHNARSSHDPTPKEEFWPGINTHSDPSPEDIANAKIFSTLFHSLENQADFLAASIMSGDFVRNQGSVIRENNRMFPEFPLELSEQSETSLAYHMSKILTMFDSSGNVIWSEDGFATDYRLPSDGGTFFGSDQNTAFLDHFCFRTIPNVWADSVRAMDVSLGWFYRMLSHRWMGFISPNGDSGWEPGPANRRKYPNGAIRGSVDYVLIHPANGDLYLTPHGILVVNANISRLAAIRHIAGIIF